MSATAPSRVTPLRVSAVQNSLGHIRRYSEVPHFNHVLTHGAEPKVKLREEKRQSMMAVLTKDSHFFVINVAREQGTPMWFHLIEQVKRLG